MGSVLRDFFAKYFRLRFFLITINLGGRGLFLILPLLMNGPSMIFRSHAFQLLFTTSCLLVLTSPALSLDRSVARVGGDLSREWLGDGTNVVVAVIDSGIDDSHAALRGNDSLGRPRLLAEKNFVPTEPTNTGNDLHGHGTGVAGVIASSDANYRGFAPDVRLINARGLNANNGFDIGAWPENAAGWAIGQGADVMNLSLNFFATSPDSSTGGYTLDRMLDWAAYDPAHRVSSVVCSGNIHNGAGNLPSVRSPAGSYNVIVVGQTGGGNYDQLSSDSSRGPTSDGRGKPDIVAPGEDINTTSRGGAGFSPWNGCSFATPHVTGMLAQMTDYGRSQSVSTDPLVLKATLLTGAEKIKNHLGQPWAPGQSAVVNGVWQTTSPLDPATGAGQMNSAATAQIYRAGEQAAGSVSSIGWDLTTLQNNLTSEYLIDIPASAIRTGRATLSTTVTWMRHVRRNDDGDGQIDTGDSFSVNLAGDRLDNLDLTLLRNGQPIAASISAVDNVEHLSWAIQTAGKYTIRVDRKNAPDSGTSEQLAVAWALLGASGDVDRDGVLSVRDVDAVSRAALRDPNQSLYDFDGNQIVNGSDVAVWATDFKRTYLGDADLDGQFNTADLVQVFQAGQFEDTLNDNSTWASGDWNADGDFGTSDLVVAFQQGGFEQGPRPAVVAVPEATMGAGMVGVSLVATWVMGRRRELGGDVAEK